MSNNPFFEKLDELERLIALGTDPPVVTAELSQLLGDKDVRREFFRRLQNPKWIMPLMAAGFFDIPPATNDESSGPERHLPWPQSTYLSRMAADAPQEVAAVFAKLPIDNAYIVGDLLEAAKILPPPIAVSLVPAVCRAALDGTMWIGFKDASDFCVRLASASEVDAAIQLADALFTPTFDAEQQKPSRRDQYWYKEGLSEVLPLLVSARPALFLTKLCDWLEISIVATKHPEAPSGSDSSYLWRPAIEEHDQNHEYDFASVMVGFVREGFENAIRSGNFSFDDALRTLEHYPYLVFKRIRLHLVNEFSDQNVILCQQAMMDQDLFNSYQFKHEYAMLVGRRFDLLSATQQQEWFAWVDAGPKRDIQARYWKFGKLHWVREHLKGPKLVDYQQMFAEYGEPELADLNVRVGPVHTGDESPMSVDKLSVMTFEQAVEAVSSWKPDDKWESWQSVDGLAATFKQYVASNPEQFSKEALLLKGRPENFIREFISQMSESVDGYKVDLPAVLALCLWTVERPVGQQVEENQKRGRGDSGSRQWTRDAVSRFLKAVCQSTSGSVPKFTTKDFRQPIWQLIEVLCHDPADSYIVCDTSKEDPRLRDYLDLAINSPRGKAVEAALEYARWVDRQSLALDGTKQNDQPDFKTMPEVQKMLEWQIAPGNRTFEVMAIIGSHIGLIYSLDKNWLVKNANNIFRLDEVEQTNAAHGWGAWNAFLVWMRPHIDFYRILKTQFAYAVEQAARVQTADGERNQPMHHLGEHLVLLNGRGQLGVDEDNGLLRRFLEQAHPDIRRHAMGFVGQVLSGDKSVPQPILERFMALWDLYWSGSGKKDAAEKSATWLFGPWFTCGQFPDQWALDRLAEFVEVDPTPEPDHEIGERLAQTADVDIAKSVQILDRMIRGDREGWRISSLREAAMKILEKAMKSPGQTHEHAVSLVDYLGRRGFTDFGHLLKQS